MSDKLVNIKNLNDLAKKLDKRTNDNIAIISEKINEIEEFVNESINNIPEGFSGDYNDLENRPCYDTKIHEECLIEYDEIKEGKEVGYYAGLDNAMFFKIADLTEEEYESYKKIFSKAPYTITQKNWDGSLIYYEIDTDDYAEENFFEREDFFSVMGLLLFAKNAVSHEEYEFEDYSYTSTWDFPSAGIYIEMNTVKAEVNRSSGDFKQLDEKFIPDTIATKEYVDDTIGDVSYAEVSDTVPTNEKVDVWINPTASEEIDIVALNDETIDKDSTWSSSKIDTELKNINNSLSKEIANVEESQYHILESAGLIGREETIITDLSSYNPTLGFITNTGTWGNINEKYQFIVIPISNTGSTLSITANDSCAAYFAGLRSYTAPTDKITIDLSEADGWTSRLAVPKSATKQYNIPDDVKYLILFVVYNTSDCTPASFYLNIPYGKGRVDILEEKVDILENGHKLKWLALGDSITEGYYSVLDENTEDTESHKSVDECYCAWIAKMKGFDLDNKGVGGSGWLKRGTAAAPKLNSREQIDAVNEDGTYVIDFTKYDICTIMWGVNDWKGSQNLGTFEDGINPETESVYGNMRYVIETILTRNPSIKLIIITPVNCRQDTSARPSSADNNWGIGFEFGGHTLDDYYDAIKKVCEYYGIEMIDMTHNSVINRINAETMLPDKVHPSLDAHRQMGLELSGKILYGC